VHSDKMCLYFFCTKMNLKMKSKALLHSIKLHKEMTRLMPSKIQLFTATGKMVKISKQHAKSSHGIKNSGYQYKFVE
jgi:hypothetical protein